VTALLGVDQWMVAWVLWWMVVDAAVQDDGVSARASDANRREGLRLVPLLSTVCLCTVHPRLTVRALSDLVFP
jgi:hypothetical protein